MPVKPFPFFRFLFAFAWNGLLCGFRLNSLRLILSIQISINVAEVGLQVFVCNIDSSISSWMNGRQTFPRFCCARVSNFARVAGNCVQQIQTSVQGTMKHMLVRGHNLRLPDEAGSWAPATFGTRKPGQPAQQCARSPCPDGASFPCLFFLAQEWSWGDCSYVWETIVSRLWTSLDQPTMKFGKP